MKHSFKSLFIAVTLSTLTIALTSCEEIFGEWSKPTPTMSTSIQIESSDLVLSIGESVIRMASTASGIQFTFSSSNPSVAMVDQQGKVTAMSEGETIITVTLQDGGGSREYKVVVKNISVAALKAVEKATPLTLVAQEDGKITVFFKGGITLASDIFYTVNGGSEQTIAKNTVGSYDIVVSKGDVVQLYSTNTSLGGGGGGAATRGATRAVDSGAKYINIRPSMKTEIYGNVMSLLKGKENLENETEILGNNAFYGLFDGADKLVNSEDRELVLPATTLKEGCYDNMFSGCKGIEKAPELPAPILETDCYKDMFANCSKLSYLKCNATDTSASGCVDGMLTGAGTEAETTPVIEVVDRTNWNSSAIPSNFQFSGVKLSNATADDIGKVIGSNGCFYVANLVLPTGVTPVANIASISSIGHGLAISMNKVKVNSASAFTWDNTGSDNNGKDVGKIFDDWNAANSVAFGTWRIASKADWHNMVISCRIDGDAIDTGDHMVAEGFVERLKQAGIFEDDWNCWTFASDESNMVAWMNLNNKEWDEEKKEYCSGPWVLECISIDINNASVLYFSILPVLEF